MIASNIAVYGKVHNTKENAIIYVNEAGGQWMNNKQNVQDKHAVVLLVGKVRCVGVFKVPLTFSAIVLS